MASLANLDIKLGSLSIEKDPTRYGYIETVDFLFEQPLSDEPETDDEFDTVTIPNRRVHYRHDALITSGFRVTGYSDLSNSGNHATQATLAQQGLLVPVPGNNKLFGPYFTGLTWYRSAASAIPAAGITVSFWSAAYFEDATSAVGVGNVADAIDGGFAMIQNATPNKIAQYKTGVTQSESSTNIPESGMHWWLSVFRFYNGSVTNSLLWIDGIAQTISVPNAIVLYPSNPSASRFLIGTVFPVTLGMKGIILDIGLCDGSLQSQVSQMNNFMRKRYGTP